MNCHKYLQSNLHLKVKFAQIEKLTTTRNPRSKFILECGYNNIAKKKKERKKERKKEKRKEKTKHAWLFYRTTHWSAPAGLTIAKANDRFLALSKVTGHPWPCHASIPLWKTSVMIIRDIKLFFVSTPGIRKNQRPIANCNARPYKETI